MSIRIRGSLNVLNIIFLVGVLVLTGLPAIAQKSKKGKQDSVDTETGNTEKDRRLTEQYFTEGEKYFILEDYTKSLAFFQKALEMDQENAAIHYKIAEIYIKNNEFDNALIHAVQARDLDPQNKYYYLLLADVYTNKSDFSKASEVYEELVKKIPGTEEYLFQAAALYIYQQKYDDALDCYERIEEIFGINEQIIFQKQNILIKQGKLNEMIREGEKLIEAYPGEPEYVADLANKLIANERFEEATELLDEAVKEFPDNPVILFQLAEVYKSTGKTEESRKIISRIFESDDFDLQKKMEIVAGYFGKELNESEKQYVLDLSGKIIEYHPEEADGYALFGDLLQSFDSLHLAREMYLKSLAINPSNLQAWTNVLDYELRNNELDSVIEHAESAITLFPNQALLYYYEGTALMLKNDNRKATQLLEQGKRLSSSNLRLLSIFNGQLGDAYNALEEYEKSDEAYEAALDFDPESDHVLNNYSYFLSLRKEKLDLAMEMASKVVKRNPDNPTYLDTYAWVLFNMGKYEEAKINIEKAIEQDQDISGTILEHYGDILFKLGDVNQAVIQWEKAKKLNVDSDLIDKKIADRKLYE
ncbi:MAG: tetratricopeptide repeat protein [Cyclobacteriaceae bacterium]|nr:tetratricopeptide repeat protein [Cyclobacteriaceae bacterium]